MCFLESKNINLDAQKKLDEKIYFFMETIDFENLLVKKFSTFCRSKKNWMQKIFLGRKNFWVGKIFRSKKCSIKKSKNSPKNVRKNRLSHIFFSKNKIFSKNLNFFKTLFLQDEKIFFVRIFFRGQVSISTFICTYARYSIRNSCAVGRGLSVGDS